MQVALAGFAILAAAAILAMFAEALIDPSKTSKKHTTHEHSEEFHSGHGGREHRTVKEPPHRTGTAVATPVTVVEQRPVPGGVRTGTGAGRDAGLIDPLHHREDHGVARHGEARPVGAQIPVMNAV